jgi:hypothetical protein
MASEIDEISIDWSDENGTLVRKQVEKEVLTRGSWTTIMFLFQELDRKTEKFGPSKVSIRRYQKRNNNYREQSKFTISSAKQAKQIIDVLEKWFKKLGDEGGDDD